jgi:hypothetical protein
LFGFFLCGKFPFRNPGKKVLKLCHTVVFSPRRRIQKQPFVKKTVQTNSTTVLQTQASLDFSNKLSMNLWFMEEIPSRSGKQ